MKSSKTITLITIILLTIVIIMASFLGVYKLKDYKMVNVLPKYSLNMDFNERRLISLEIDDSVKETQIYDKEGNLVTEQEEGIDYTEENGYRIVEKKVNSDDVLNEENYKIAKLILENRLKGRYTKEYLIRDNENGSVQIEIPEDENADETVNFLIQKGEFELVDEDTEELLLNNSNVEYATITYSQEISGTTVYLQLKFDEEGAEKLREISKTYTETVIQKENEKGELEDITETKNVTVLFDGQTFGTTYFGEEITNGTLNLTVGTSADRETLQKYLNNASTLANVINTGIIPITYNATYQVEKANVNAECINTAIYVISGITILSFVYLIVKFKLKGIVGAFMQTGYIALLALVLRYTNVTLTLTGILGTIVSIFIGYILVYIMLINIDKNKIKKFIIDLIPVYITIIIFSFSSILDLASVGMAMLWGIASMYLYHLTCTKTILKQITK